MAIASIQATQIPYFEQMIDLVSLSLDPVGSVNFLSKIRPKEVKCWKEEKKYCDHATGEPDDQNRKIQSEIVGAFEEQDLEHEQESPMNLSYLF